LFLRFWRGRCSPALSFWVVAPLVAVLAFALPEGVGYLVRGQDFDPFLILAAIIAIWAIVVFAQLYPTVGVWRSAADHRRDITIGKRRLWGVAAQAVLVVVSISCASSSRPPCPSSPKARAWPFSMIRRCRPIRCGRCAARSDRAGAADPRARGARSTGRGAISGTGDHWLR
jgi:hypothetical protein